MRASSSYVLGVYQAGIDSGALAPTSFEKMAQQADIAAAALGARWVESSNIVSNTTTRGRSIKGCEKSRSLGRLNRCKNSEY
mgnify:CR=1 FL=1